MWMLTAWDFLATIPQKPSAEKGAGVLSTRPVPLLEGVKVFRLSGLTPLNLACDSKYTEAVAVLQSVVPRLPKLDLYRPVSCNSY